ncbi:MAG TPA: MBL fold metallo-hydrolase [Candidatus Limiplasma sp.]|nr:MBL fold metallo-hydrolase [Candidatus Limiplasma sp.]HPS80661.1 MBL fold metallo-hydrolase [Candidatus Limiplasma sp.]
MKNQWKAAILSALVGLALLTHTAAMPAQAEGAAAQTEVKALFLNVGKADAALFCLGEKRYLIDTGTKESADAMLQALRYFEVDRLDGVLITHIDSDHVGGLKALLKSGIVVDRLYAATFHNAKSIAQHPVAKQAEKYGLPLTWLNSGDQIEIDAAARFTVLGPLTRDPNEENNNSLVLWLDTSEGTMLLAGDMEVPEETALLAAGLIRQTDVLKVGNHGDGDASGEGFIYTAKPQIAVISTSTQEKPSTPDPSVMGRLWNIGAKVLETQKATCCVEVTLKGGQATGTLVDYPTP